MKLEDVTRRQKEMEEKNRRKRDLLSKAISERYIFLIYLCGVCLHSNFFARKKKASAESQKLKRIQTEFTKLDENLSFDVSILRDKITDASISYTEAK